MKQLKLRKGVVVMAMMAILAVISAGSAQQQQPVESIQIDNNIPYTTSLPKMTSAEIQTTTPAPPPVVEEPVPVVFYLTDQERDVVERVVMAESGGEQFDGQKLVAQCILNACEKTGLQPSEAVVEYKYTGSRPEPTEQVKEAVSAVFDDGDFYTDEPILFFYAKKYVEGKWHETQDFVVELGGHRFFKEKGNNE